MHTCFTRPLRLQLINGIDTNFGTVLSIELRSNISTGFQILFSVSLGHDPKPYNKQLSELRYSGIKTEGAPSLLEVIRYIGRNLLGWFLISKEGL